MSAPSFDEWEEKQEVKYKLVVEVNDEIVYEAEYTTVDNLYEEGRKHESAVNDKLHDEFESENECLICGEYPLTANCNNGGCDE